MTIHEVDFLEDLKGVYLNKGDRIIIKKGVSKDDLVEKELEVTQDYMHFDNKEEEE